MGESVIRMKPIAHENEKIRAKTGEQKMVSPEMAVKMLKKDVHISRGEEDILKF